MAETIREKNILFRILSDASSFNSGVSKAVAETDRLEKKVNDVRKSNERRERDRRQNFLSEESASRKRIANLKKEEAELEKLTRQRKKAYRTDDIQSYNQQISATQQRIRLLRGDTDKLSGATNQLSGLLSKAGIAFSAAYAVDKVKDFLVESVKLANQTRNVRLAFNQLRGASNILNDLREATSGTVDDLTLMRQAVRANNFRIPLNQLATFFQFASDRAAATGESVDYLVSSIVDGIGRKSTLVLDNLGISAVRIQEEIKKTGDFGQAAANIIAEEMAKANVVVDEGARAGQRLEASYKNFQETVGKVLAGGANSAAGRLAGAIQGINDVIVAATDAQQTYQKALSSYGSTVEEVTAQLEKYRAKQEELDRQGRSQFDDFRRTIEVKIEQSTARLAQLRAQAISTFTGPLNTIEDFNKAISDTGEEISMAIAIFGEGSPTVDSLRQRLILLDDEFKKFKAVTDTTSGSLNVVKGNLFDLEQRINALVAEQKAETTTIARVKQITDELNDLYKEQDELLGRVKKGTDDYKKSMADLADEIADFNQESIDARTNFDAWLKFYEDSERASKAASKANVDFFEGLFNIPEEPSGAAIGEPDFERTKDVLDKNTELYSAYASTVTGILGSINSYQNALYEAELQSLKSQLDNKVITEQQYELRVSQEKRKRAQADKRLSLFEIAIDTASSVAQTAANLGYPAAIPFVALAIAQGAAQAALVSAEPIPQFAKGVTNFEGGMAIVGEEGPELVKLPKGSDVYTANETKKSLNVFDAIKNNPFDQFAQEHYIRPTLLNQQISPRQSTVEGYNDYRLIKTVRENRNVGIKNADDIGRSVARHLNHNNWLSRKFR